jgi:hypothetical protein
MVNGQAVERKIKGYAGHAGKAICIEIMGCLKKGPVAKVRERGGVHFALECGGT